MGFFTTAAITVGGIAAAKTFAKDPRGVSARGTSIGLTGGFSEAGRAAGIQPKIAGIDITNLGGTVFGGEEDGGPQLLDSSGRPRFPQFKVEAPEAVTPGLIERLRQTAPTTQFQAESALLRAQRRTEQDRIRQQQGTAIAQATGQLAASGGITGGARERIAQGARRGVQASTQALAQRNELLRLQALQEDAKRRRANAFGIAGTEQFDVNARLKQQELLQNFLLGKFQTQGQIFGSGQTAQAILQSRPQGGLLGGLTGGQGLISF